VSTQILTRLIDDLDGSEATQTVTFALDGTNFEIDLSATNAKRLREILTPYIEHSSRARHRSITLVMAATGSDQSRAIREWARRKGYHVASSGRIKQEIVEAYHLGAGRRQAGALPKTSRPPPFPTAPRGTPPADQAREPGRRQPRIQV
jgi:hypothetical protein